MLPPVSPPHAHSTRILEVTFSSQFLKETTSQATNNLKVNLQSPLPSKNTK